MPGRRPSTASSCPTSGSRRKSGRPASIAFATASPSSAPSSRSVVQRWRPVLRPLRPARRSCNGRAMDCDLILRGGTILDGTGADAVPGSVLIVDGRIAALGAEHGASAAQIVDCTGKVVAPGFIDMHSHSDWVIPQPDHGRVLAPLLEQGITTIVAGNCGCSPAPYLPSNRTLLPQVGRMLHDHDLDYGWSSTAEFLGTLEVRGLALNIAQLVGHGTVRSAVKGLSPTPA